jgi:hypothetical protein
VEEVAARLRSGEHLSGKDLHEGILAYVCFLNGWPPLYPCISEMEPEPAEVLLYCLRSETAAKGGDDELLQVQTTAEDLWRAMGILPRE